MRSACGTAKSYRVREMHTLNRTCRNHDSGPFPRGSGQRRRRTGSGGSRPVAASGSPRSEADKPACDGGLSPSGSMARARLSQCRAQRNSLARIASPSGKTRKAGPGNTSMAIPTNTTLLTTRRITRDSAKTTSDDPSSTVQATTGTTTGWLQRKLFHVNSSAAAFRE